VVNEAMPASYLTAPDPYTGQPWDAPSDHPPAIGVILQEAFAEPLDVRVCDPQSGFLLRREAAPRFKCLFWALTYLTHLVGQAHD